MISVYKGVPVQSLLFDSTGTKRAIVCGITKENYCKMKERIGKLPANDTVKGSSNLGIFLKMFSDENDE